MQKRFICFLVQLHLELYHIQPLKETLILTNKLDFTPQYTLIAHVDVAELLVTMQDGTMTV